MDPSHLLEIMTFVAEHEAELAEAVKDPWQPALAITAVFTAYNFNFSDKWYTYILWRQKFIQAVKNEQSR